MKKENLEPDESPTLGEGEPKEKEKEETKPDATQVDVDALIAELEKAGVTNTEALHNKLAVTKEYGKVVNMLGELKAENRQLKEMLESKPAPGDFDYSETSGSPDLADIINKVLDKRDAMKAQQQAQYNKAVLEMWNEIQSDQDYELIKDVWEEKTRDPNFIFMVQQGQVNPVKEYNKMVREYYKGIAKRSVETIKVLSGKEKVKPPYVESGNARVPGIESKNEESDQEKKLKGMKESVEKGA